MVMMPCVNELSRNYIHRHTHRLKKDQNLIRKWTLTTIKDNYYNSKKKTLCSMKKTTKRLIGPCYKIRCSASTTCTSFTKSTTARAKFISRPHTRKSSRTLRTWTLRAMGFNRVGRELAQPVDITLKVVRMASALCNIKSTTTCRTST